MQDLTELSHSFECGWRSLELLLESLDPGVGEGVWGDFRGENRSGAVESAGGDDSCSAGD